MCGLAGLSVGCVNQDGCSKSNWLKQLHQNQDTPGLEKTWDKRASVRNAPRRLVEKLEASNAFPREMIPVLNVKESSSLDPQTQEILTVNHLYRYLNFTTLLESWVVNKVLLDIYFQRTGVQATTERRIDALRMYTDEAYHALAAADIAAQVSKQSGIPDRYSTNTNAEFIQRIDALKSKYPMEYSPLIELVVVIVSETLISGNLSEVSNDTSVESGIRQTIEDHAKDEGRHHTFFYHYLKDLWSSLDGKQRHLVGLIFPEAITLFFAPEKHTVHQELLDLGIKRHVAFDLLDSAYDQDKIDQTIRDSASAPLKYAEELGMLDIPEVSAQFAEKGLIPCGR